MKAAELSSRSVDAFERQLTVAASLLEPTLEALLPKEGRLAEAMRYAVLGVGKRFRPFLVFESAKLFNVPAETAVNVAAAVELLHCYSLVHDDLPAMDDDDMRRGKPSVHKKFDEATAILAGDALQSLAFETMSRAGTELVREFAAAIGWAGMAGGQQLDLQTSPDVERMSAMKTGALVTFSVVSGAVMANNSNDQRAALVTYGSELGRAFQISDDLLDAGKDSAVGKRTFVTTFGMQEAKRMLEASASKAIRALELFGQRAVALREAAEYMRRRTG